MHINFAVTDYKKEDVFDALPENSVDVVRLVCCAKHLLRQIAEIFAVPLFLAICLPGVR